MWRKAGVGRGRVRAAVGVIVLLQIAIPLWVLAQPDRPARFGWQMYAGLVTPLKITVVSADGARRRIAQSEVLGRPRPELRYHTHLTRLLCRRYRATRVVAIRRAKPPLRIDGKCPST